MCAHDVCLRVCVIRIQYLVRFVWVYITCAYKFRVLTKSFHAEGITIHYILCTFSSSRTRSHTAIHIHASIRTHRAAWQHDVDTGTSVCEQSMLACARVRLVVLCLGVKYWDFTLSLIWGFGCIEVLLLRRCGLFLCSVFSRSCPDDETMTTSTTTTSHSSHSSKSIRIAVINANVRVRAVELSPQFQTITLNGVI